MGEPQRYINDLKARVDVVKLLELLGARFKLSHKGGTWDDEIQVYCPFCADKDSKKPAGRANQVKGMYFCFNCGLGGDVIKLVRLADPLLTFDEALQWLEDHFPVEEKPNPWTT